jgi:MGT family glycosyltransferase
MEGEMMKIFSEINPDLFIISTFLRMEIMLLYYKYNIHPVVLTTYLREPDQTFVEECIKTVVAMPGDISTAIIAFLTDLGISFSSLRELFLPAEKFHEIVVCPEEFDANIFTSASKPGANLTPAVRESGKKASGNNIHYIGPSVFPERDIGDQPDLGAIKKGSEIIYASLGSFALYQDAAGEFFIKMVQVMRDKEMTTFHLILSVGLEFDIALLGALPANVTVMRWGAQTDILKVSSLVITHGGLGTIKESIYYGVPMIVIPVMFDQPRNAALVEYHNMGIRLQLKELSTDSLKSGILQVLNNSDMMDSTKRMQKIFQEKETSRTGVEIIERLLMNDRNRTPFVSGPYTRPAENGYLRD